MSMSETETNGEAVQEKNESPLLPTVEARLKDLEARLCDVEQRRQEIERSAAKVDKLALKLDMVTEERKYARQEWEEAVKKHMALCRHWSKSEEVASRPLIAAIEGKADPAPADESWRDEPIEVLQMMGFLEPVIVGTLLDSRILTLGYLSDWRQDHDGFSNIDGIGPEMSLKVEEAWDRYWDARAADVQDADDDEDEDDLDAAEDAEAAADAVEDAAAHAKQLERELYCLDTTEDAEAADDERSGLDLVTSRPDSTPESNGVPAAEARPKRRRSRKAKA